MARFRKKPIVIEAEQFWEGEPYPDGVETTGCEHCDWMCPHVHTLEGPLRVSDGDWIITGIQGERYPCKPDVFELTYEPADPERSE